MLRNIGGIVAGIAVGIVVIGLIESLGHMIFPPPDGVDLKNPEALKSIMGEIPLGAKIAVLVAWGLGVFAGGAVARLIARAKYAALYVGLFLLAGAAYTMTQIPHPLWMAIGAFVVTAAGVFAANALTRAKTNERN